MRLSSEPSAPSSFQKIDTSSPEAVQRRVAYDYWRMYPNGNQAFIPWAFQRVHDYFQGKVPGYLPIDARYHDWEHTLQGTLAFSTLLSGRVDAGASPILHQEMGELGLLAILLHDTGYLKKIDDVEGTGAKYTMTHVNRSCDFAEPALREWGFTSRQIQSVQHMIRCTGLGLNVDAIPFQSEEEHIAGCALGTADLLGQMAAPDYLEKLPILFEELQESAVFNRGKGGPPLAFTSAADLCQKTPGFWRKYVRPRLEEEFLGLYRYLARPAPEGPNAYIEAIEANIQRLERQLAEAA